MSRWQSSVTPRSWTEDASTTFDLPMVISERRSCCLNREDNCTTFVFDSLHTNSLSANHSRRVQCISEDKKCYSVKEIYQSIYKAVCRQLLIMSSRGATCRENKDGPKTDPCGTPRAKRIGSDVSSPILTDNVRSLK